MKPRALKKNVPRGWSRVNLGSVSDVCSGGTPDTGNMLFWGGEINWITPTEITKTGKFIRQETTKKLTELGLKHSSAKLLPSGSLVVCTRATVGECSITTYPISTNQGFKNLIPTKDTTVDYLYYLIKSLKKKLISLGSGSTFLEVSKGDIENLKIDLPSILEQKRIVAVLEAWDYAVEILLQIIEKKQNLKKALMWRLLTGRHRLVGFDDQWQTVEIGELLDYEQPTKYLVKDTDYSDKNKIPVLTANKAFILGYTYEDSGVYTNYPVIIFDDFTMDSKFVDFTFKVKSSAIKMLTPKNHDVSLKFVFERMQLIKVVIGQHRRHYLSEYQYKTIEIPGIEEQNAVAKILGTIDGEIRGLKSKLRILKDQKRFLLDNLMSGTIRTSENLKIKK